MTIDKVMHEEFATAKQLSLQKKGSFFIIFFGDNSHGRFQVFIHYRDCVESLLYSELLTIAWSTQKELERFECNYETMRKQTCNKASHVKAFSLAIQEAKEVWDRRCGRIPATSFHPLDVLDKSTWPEDWGGPTGEAREVESVQEPPW